MKLGTTPDKILKGNKVKQTSSISTRNQKLRKVRRNETPGAMVAMMNRVTLEVISAMMPLSFLGKSQEGLQLLKQPINLTQTLILEAIQIWSQKCLTIRE